VTAKFDAAAIAAELRRLGRILSPQLIETSQGLYAPHHEREPYADVSVIRDIAYGADERQRLDLFAPKDGASGRPILLFVHGGGFVGGDKKRPGTPYHDNVALFAVRHGMVGVNMTYRLAPQHPWPAGAADVGAAVGWLRDHAAAHGGDAERIFVLGTSAGAAHVASYVAHPRFHPADKPAAAGAIILSGIYDIATAQRGKLLTVYFGADETVYGERSSLPGLLETEVPLLFGIAELEPPDFERQALRLIGAWMDRHGHWPRFIRLMGHNHFTATLHLNTADDTLGREILDLVRSSGAS
jgi:acetyl esterase/lipase